jgi:hypothetical protein
MRSLKAFAVTLSLATLALTPSASADQWNKKTILDVQETIQVPGAVLQPGKYVMKLMDSPANRHIVQVFNEREDHLYTTILAIPNYRLDPTGETQFGWWETPAGQPKALRAWFYPGDNFGQEFAYPKNEALAIAKATNENVPTTYAENEADLATSRVGTVDREGTEMELDRETYSRSDGTQPNTPAENEVAEAQEPAPAPTVTQPQQEETQIAQAQPEPAPQQEITIADDAETLPRTASPMPLAGLAGLLALGAGVAVRSLSRRS